MTRERVIRIVINAAGFNAGWFACILGSRWGMWWIGPIVVAGVLAVHFALHEAPRREALAIATIAPVGVAIDTAFRLTGLLVFDEALWAYAVWMLAFWTNFGATLSVSLFWLARLPVLAIALGAVSAPSTYFAGMKLDAIGMTEPPTASLIAIGIEWAIALPVALWWVRRIHRGRGGEAAGTEVEPA